MHILKFFDLVEIHFDWRFTSEHVNHDFRFTFVVVHFVHFTGKVSEWSFFDHNCFTNFKVSFCTFFNHAHAFKNAICFFWK
ncbi:transcription antitermination factor [Listeria monocytogenes]|nr:transcription antitermination factor [Listeria monocytogenes]